MKRKFFEMLFKKELVETNAALIRCSKEAQSKVEEIKQEMNKVKKQFNLVKHIVSNTNVKIVGVETNKKEEEFLVTEEITATRLWIILYGLSYQEKINSPRIMSIIENNHDGNKYIRINDIDMMNNSVGNGFIAMKYFLMSAKNLGVDYIVGNLSPVDKDHFERLERYYKKFEFEVELSDDRTRGKIKKVMK